MDRFYKYLTLCTLTLIFGFNLLNAQCGQISALASVAEFPQGGGNCSFNLVVNVNNSGGTLPGSADYSIQLNDGTVLGVGCIEDINPNRLAPIVADVIAPCGSNLNVVYIGKSTADCSGTGCSSGFVSRFVGSPLNVELAQFRAYSEKSDVMLEWITETETDNDYFEIEHSTDGRTFKTVDKVDGNGTTTQTNVYHFMHQYPVNGINYYRLKLMDFDGTTHYGPITLIELELKEVINIFPTSVQDIVNIKLTEKVTENTPVYIFNSMGQQAGIFQINNGDNNLEINTNDLNAGLYYIKVKLQGIGIITEPFVKKTL